MARILIDQAHNQAWALDADDAKRMNPTNPADASYGKLASSLESSGHTIVSHQTGLIDSAALSEVDLLIIPHASADEWEKTLGNGSPILAETELAAIEKFVASGGGLLILGETEQPKYGNNFNQLSELFGITIANATVQDPEKCFKDVATWIRPEFHRHVESDFSYRVDGICLYRTGVLEASPTSDSEVIMRSSETASPANAPLGIAAKHHSGRVAVLADSDLFGDDSIEDLDNRQFLLNITGWLANARVVANADLAKKSHWALTDKNWLKLQATIEALRPMQLGR